MKPQGFPRSSRLLRRPEFLNIYARGRRASGHWIVVYTLARPVGPVPSASATLTPAPPSPEPSALLLPWRVGITATRKLGNAVARNRARRQVREFIRRHRPCWPAGIDFVVNLKPAAAQASTADLHRDLTYVFRKLGYDTAAEPVPQAHAETPSAVIAIPAEHHV